MDKKTLKALKESIEKWRKISFCRGIDHKRYLEILRNNEDAHEIAEPICEKLYNGGSIENTTTE